MLWVPVLGEILCLAKYCESMMGLCSGAGIGGCGARDQVPFEQGILSANHTANGAGEYMVLARQTS